jgi:hypothetical protein
MLQYADLFEVVAFLEWCLGFHATLHRQSDNCVALSIKIKNNYHVGRHDMDASSVKSKDLSCEDIPKALFQIIPNIAATYVPTSDS